VTQSEPEKQTRMSQVAPAIKQQTDTAVVEPDTMANGVRGPWPVVLLVAAAAVALFLFLRPVVMPVRGYGGHYLYLARHLSQGDLTVDSLPSRYQDHVEWDGHKYLPLGPLPGVLLIPFLPLANPETTKDVVWVGYLFTALNVWLFWRVLGLAGVRDERRGWTTLLFFGGTTYLSVAAVGTSWFFAHVVVTTFLLAAMAETLGMRRAWLVGLYMGLAGLTRMTALFALPFFLWMFWRGRREETEPRHGTERAPLPLREAGLLAAGLAVPLALLFAYNYARFGNILESGYAHAVLVNPVLAEALSHGLFSVVHIPKNLFMMLLQGPLPYPNENAAVLTFPYVQPSQWGMGLFFVTPALVYAFRAPLRSPLVQACWIAVLAIMVPVITYYGIGWIQFGFRYALDFFPFLMVLVALGLPRPMTVLSRALVLVSVAVSVWGTLWLISWV
jgi:hypothetical protein